MKCLLNLCLLVLGIHDEDMAIWYGDQGGIIEIELAINDAYILAALVGLANLPSHPCLGDLLRITQTRQFGSICRRWD